MFVPTGATRETRGVLTPRWALGLSPRALFRQSSACQPPRQSLGVLVSDPTVLGHLDWEVIRPWRRSPFSNQAHFTAIIQGGWKPTQSWRHPHSSSDIPRQASDYILETDESAKAQWKHKAKLCLMFGDKMTFKLFTVLQVTPRVAWPMESTSYGFQ